MFASRFTSSGLRAKVWPILAGTLGFLGVACADDETPAPSANGGTSGDSNGAGGTRQLPGVGLEPTPDYDIDRRPLRPPSDRQIGEAIEDLLGFAGSAGNPPDATAPDGSTPDADTDAAADEALPDAGAALGPLPDPDGPGTIDVDAAAEAGELT